jgi:hypothetical protein
VRAVWLVLALLALPAAGATPPWARTEAREPCAGFDPLRRPFFGDLHVHTRFSADAYIFGTRVGPRDAYDFARGTTIPVSDDVEEQARTATIDRPLDFTAVTDHAELFGEVDRCITPDSSVYDVLLCRLLRQVEGSAGDEGDATVSWLFPLGIPDPPTQHEFCATPGVDCDASAISVWQEMQAAAEEAYDRTAACTFTSFIGYEHTPSPLGRHRHRNVIFRNHVVPPIALSHLDTLAGGVPQGLWNALEAQCTAAAMGCDALVIPHNSNLSGGEQFVDPVDGADALRRQTFEPLVELHQVKGNSECRFDRLAGIGVGTTDELCAFEQDPMPFQGPFATPLPIPEYYRRNLIRPTLADGLAFEQALGANPFRFGFVGGTDTHNANAGDVEEAGWVGAQGSDDGSVARLIDGNLSTNPGGLTVAWAEENSRDALFAALRRREAYATSGTRSVVRFFAGALDGVACGRSDLVARAYETGTPMGGEIGAVRGRKSPRFAVWAMKDPGTEHAPGTDLQRVQIVKGWVDADGATHERVVDVAGDAANGAGVDPATCAPTGTGAAELCAVWEDPEFDARERAFYYARVVENPVCRWSTRVCKQAGIDPFAPDCAAQAAPTPELADCCRPGDGDPFLMPTIQERAWTSPVWYRPDTVGRLRARLAFGRTTGRDRLTLRAALPATLDPARDGLVLRLSDDDDVLHLRVRSDGFRRRGARLVHKDPTTRTTLVLSRGRLLLNVGRADLAAAARETHPMTFTVESGVFRAAHLRTWRLRGRGLAPEGR